MPNLIGKSIDRYHILEQLGEGGMAIVYKAYDTRLERDVAIKIIRTDLFGASVLERILKRFEREAKSLARLSHPNIIKVIDYGEYEGSPYLVMEYMPGGTLKQKLGKPMPWQEAVRLLIPIAEALEYAHEQKIVHRDVKPSNILLMQKGQPMLTDFGIAKILENEDAATLTGAGLGVGTPEYMAPEQWTGSATAQSDIYSLGVVLYEMVTGRKPYTADTPAAILLKQATEPLPRPSAHVRDLPDSIEKVLLKALARNPKDRYKDADALVEGLENLLAGTSKSRISTATLRTSKSEEPDLNTRDAYLQEEKYSANTQTKSRNVSPRKLRETSSQDSPATQPQNIVWWPWGVLVIVIIIGIVYTLNSRETARRMSETATAQAYEMQETATAQAYEETATAQAYEMQETATAQAYEIQTTATAQAHMNLINSWNLVLNDRFTNTDNGWGTGGENNDYYEGNSEITNGKLVWRVDQSKQGFVYWMPPPYFDNLTDFYLSVEAHRTSGPETSACYGLRFRGDGSNYYFYEACDDQTYQVSSHSEQDGWDVLLGYENSNAIKPGQTNKLAVVAQGSYFEFYINDQLVNTLDDSRWSSGSVGIMIEMSEGDTATFEFDNFILRSP